MTELNHTTKQKNLRRNVLIVITVLYFLLLIWAIVFKCNNIEGLHIEQNRSRSIVERLMLNIIPFKRTIEHVLAGSPLETLATIFNVIGFMPMTMLFRYLKMGKLQSWLIAAGVSLGVEVFQLFSCWGGLDISDWILNVFGAYLGLVAFGVFNKLSYKAQYIIIVGCGIIVLPVDIFAIVNTITHFPPLG